MSFPPTGLLKPSIQAHGIPSIVTHGRGKPRKGTMLLRVGELTYAFTPVCIFLCHGVACRNLHFFRVRVSFLLCRASVLGKMQLTLA